MMQKKKKKKTRTGKPYVVCDVRIKLEGQSEPQFKIWLDFARARWSYFQEN